ncbi:hypothetical protein TcasGA2_TC013461 [Tribolium castaneum]|uniref:Uncharacterized protein n=1 Tax=Tribolium castaneum TaxID=7070 RepID=D6WLD2_TRICA|nr:hypothetical protein TcasGA2_TC013461 [Tribolium castaneum]
MSKRTHLSGQQIKTNTTAQDEYESWPPAVLSSFQGPRCPVVIDVFINNAYGAPHNHKIRNEGSRFMGTLLKSQQLLFKFFIRGFTPRKRTQNASAKTLATYIMSCKVYFQ